MNRSAPGLWILLGIALAIRLWVAAATPADVPFMDQRMAWVMRAASGEPHTLAGDAVVPWLLSPVYRVLGVAWTLHDPTFARWQSSSFALWMRLPALVADLVCLLLLLRIGRRWTAPRQALWVPLFILFNPALILASSVLGAPELVVLALGLAALHHLLANRPRHALAFMAMSLLSGPSAWSMVLALLFWASRRSARDAPRPASGTLVTGLALVCFERIVRPLVTLAPHGIEARATADTFNLWYLLTGNATLASHEVAKISIEHYALVFFALAGGLLLLATNGEQKDEHLFASLPLIPFLHGMIGADVFPSLWIPAIGFLALRGGTSFLLATGSVTLNLFYAMDQGPRLGMAIDAGLGILLAFLNLMVVGRLMQDGMFPSESYDGPRPPLRPVILPWPRELMLVLVLTVGFGGLRYHRLEHPPKQIFDEVYHSKAGEEIYAGESPNEWVHPPLAKLLIGLGIKRFGMDSFGWRFVPWLFGTLVVPVFWFLARGILRDSRFATLATLLLCLDGVYFVQSRTAMTNVFALFFQISAVTCFWYYLEQSGKPGGRLGNGVWLLGTSLMIGLGLCTRWTCLWLLGFLGGMFALHGLYSLWRHGREGVHPALLVLWGAGGILSGIFHFLLVPISLYFLSYGPLVRWGCYATLKYVSNLQPQIWMFHSTFTTHHPYYSPWYTWAFLYRPVWYSYETLQDDKVVEGILALGNPILWWISIPVVVLTLVAALKDGSRAGLFVVATYGALYLPWLLSPRVFNYGHYYLEPLPYALLGLAYLLQRAEGWHIEYPEIVMFVLLVAAVFAFFHPLLSGMPLPVNTYNYRVWATSWY